MTRAVALAMLPVALGIVLGSCSEPAPTSGGGTPHSAPPVTATQPPPPPAPWDPDRVDAEAGATTPTRPIPDDGVVVHVSTAGHDSTDGSARRPWRTLGHAIAAAPDGATVVVHAGTYHESAGDLRRPLHVMAAPGESVVVSGSDPIGGWRADVDGTFVTEFDSPLPQPGHDDYRILPEQVADGSPLAGHLDQLFLDGEPLVQVARADAVVGRADVFHYDDGTSTLRLGADPTGRTVEVSTRQLGLKLHPGAAGSTIAGLTFSGFSPFHDDGFAAVVIDATGVALTDVTVTASAATGLAVYKGGVVVTRLTSSRNGGRGAVANEADGLIVTYSRFDANNLAGYDHDVCGRGVFCVLAGLKVTRTANLTVAASSFQDNVATGLWCDLACVDAVFVGNVVAGNHKHGLYFEVSRGALAAGNVFAGHATEGTAALRISGSDDVHVTRNTFVANLTDVAVLDDPRDVDDELASAGVDTDPSGVVLVANAFVESADLVARVGDRAVLDTGEPTAAHPVPEWFARLDANLYILSSATEPGPPFRFRWIDADGTIRYVATPDAFAALSGEIGSSTIIDPGGAAVDGYRLLDDPPVTGVAPPPDMATLLGVPDGSGRRVGAWFAD